MPCHDIQLGQNKFTPPEKEVAPPATFVKSFILLCKKSHNFGTNGPNDLIFWLQS